MQTKQSIPAGYRKDAQGRLVPESMLKPIDKTRDELVEEMFKKAVVVRDTLVQFKGAVFADVNAFVTLSAEQYGVSLGGKKGNVTLYSFDGRYKVQVATAENLVFDERLQAAKALIDECIREWSQGSRPEIQVLVQDAFKTDREGNLNTGRVLGLRRLEITDDKWQRAMKAIGESVQVVGSKQYIRFYERVGESDQYSPISLDIASA
jgi:hypothetical protein